MKQVTGDKVKTLKEAVKLVSDGDSIAFSGLGISAHPVAFAHELIRQGKRNLEIAGSCAWIDNVLLIGAGCVNRMMVLADLLEFKGVIPGFRRAVEKGELKVEDYSFLAYASRLMAAAMGVSFLPTKSLLGSDMLRQVGVDEANKFRVMKCPFTGEKVVLVPALKPDVAVIHAHQADEDGNVQLFWPTVLADEQARASTKVIVTVEKIVDRAIIRRMPEKTTIPSFVVDAIVEIPYGAHPTAMNPYYDCDMNHFLYVYEQSKCEEKFKQYLNEFIFGVDSHQGYIERVGGVKKILQLRNNSQTEWRRIYER